jgi:plastocyanin
MSIINRYIGTILSEITIIFTLISVPLISLMVSPAVAQNPTSISIVSGASNPNNKQFYNPPSLTVQVGTLVNWTNNDNSNHTVTSVLPVTGPILQFDSGIISPINGKFGYKFETPGNFSYYCKIHPFMTGQIIVH